MSPPSQWETTLNCNVVSHWLGTYTKWQNDPCITVPARESAVWLSLLVCSLPEMLQLWIISTGSSIGRVFRSPLRRRRKMAALPLPVAILDDLICGKPEMRSSKMATGSGRAAIFLRLRNGDRKTRPRSWMTSLPTSPSWIQDGNGGNDVWRTSRRSTDVCPIHESCRSLTLLRFKKHLIVSLTQALSKWLSELPACYYAEVISLHMSKVVKNLRLQQAPTLLFFFFYFILFYFFNCTLQ